MPGARLLWAATGLVALAWLAWRMVWVSGAQTALERAFVALMLLSMNATGVAIGNGQVIVHILALLVAAVSLLE